jgi:hypothetical protein
MAVKPWSTVYSGGSLDTNTQQPTLIDGADVTQVSQIHAMRDAVQTIEAVIGTSFAALSGSDVLTQLQNLIDRKVTLATHNASDFTASANFNYIITAATGGGDQTITLPSIATGNSGKEIEFKLRVAPTANVNITPNAGNTIDSSVSAVALTGSKQCIRIRSDGVSDWTIISRYLM